MTKAAELAKMGEVLTNSQIGGRRNIIINGAMQVAQRGTSSTGLGAETSLLLDRFSFGAGSTAGRATMSQVADVHDGFAKALKLECTTADTSIAAAEQAYVIYKFEGQELQQLKKGTSDAEKMTLSFYVKGNAAATYVAELEDYDNSSRHVGKTFNVTTSWNRVSIIFPADTTGVLGEDNAVGIALNIHLHSGSNNTSGTGPRETWGTLSQSVRVGSGKTSFLDSTSRELYITGVKLETTQVTDFIHNTYLEDMNLCRRYYYNVYYSPPAGNAGYNNSYGTRMPYGIMRSVPSEGYLGTKTAYPGGVNNNSSHVSEATIRTNQAVSVRWQYSGDNSKNYFDVDMTLDSEL